MGAKEEAADVLGPTQGRIHRLPLTTGSVSHDMSAAARFNGSQWIGKFVSLTADQQTAYFWTDTAGQTVSESATTGTTQGATLVAGVETHQRPGGRYLVIKGAVAGSVVVCLTQGFAMLGEPRIP